MRRSKTLKRPAAPADHNSVEDEVQEQEMREAKAPKRSLRRVHSSGEFAVPEQGLFESLPNELLEMIFRHLPFKDKMQCSDACKRFRALSMKFYIDTWPVNEKLSTKVRRCASTDDSLVVVYANRAVDFFEFSPNDARRIYRTAACGEGALKGLFCYHLAIIPNSKCIAYGHYVKNKVFVFDVENARTMAECGGIREPPGAGVGGVAARWGECTWSIGCSSRAIVVVREFRSSHMLYLYAWNGREAVLARTMPTIEGAELSISPGGLLAFQTRDSRIQLYDCDLDADCGVIDIGLRSVRRLAMNSDATRLAVSSKERTEHGPFLTQTAEHGIILSDTTAVSSDLRVYDIGGRSTRWCSKSIVFQSNRALPRAIGNFALSPDGRMLLVRGCTVDVVSIFPLEEDGRQIWVHLPKRDDHAIYQDRSIIFREINRIPHLQVLTQNDDLKLYRLPESDPEKRCSALEKKKKLA